MQKLTGWDVARKRVLHTFTCYAMRVMAMHRKTNITLKLAVDLLRSVKVAAAKRGTSINAFAAETLAAVVEHLESYEQSKKRALALMKENTAFGWRKPKSRDELHER